MNQMIIIASMNIAGALCVVTAAMVQLRQIKKLQRMQARHISQLEELQGLTTAQEPSQ